MTDRTDQPPDHAGETPGLPPALNADLRALYAGPVSVPPALDASIWASARRNLSRRRMMRWTWRLTAGAAAVAVLLVVGSLALRQFYPAAGGGGGAVPGGSMATRTEMGSTIMDAFQLARQLRTGLQPDPQWDINGDGKVDQTDIDLLARRAVSLKRGTL